MSDTVEHPGHYTHGGIECWDAISAALGPEGFEDYCRGNVIKYLWRCRDKGGVEDLRKARQYLDRMISDAQRAYNESVSTRADKAGVSADEMAESITRCASRTRNKGCMVYGRGEAE